MKSFLFTALFLMFSVGTITANSIDFENTNDNTNFEIVIENDGVKQTVELEFNSYADFLSFDYNEIIPNFDKAEELCTVNISVTVSVGVVSVTLGMENIPCSDVADTVSTLVSQVKDMLNNML